jgi:hypothetical protein
MIGVLSLAIGTWLVTGATSTAGIVGRAAPPLASHEVTETITLFGPNGQPSRIVRFPGGSMPLALSFRAVRPAQRDSLARLRNVILAEVNRRRDLDRPLRYGRPALMARRAKMARLLVVLEALSARSESEYHRIIAHLGVVVTRTSSHDSAGRAGVRTDYLLDGKAQVSRFTSSSPASAQEVEATRGGPSADAASPSWVVCDWTDEDGMYWSGECASQQQIDDAASLLAATNSDMNDVVIDAANDVSYCQQIVGCWDSNDLATEGYRRGGPTADAAECWPFERCYSQALSLSLTMAGYFRQAYKLGALVTAIAPPAGAIADTAISLALVAGGAYLAGRALSDCLLQP